MFSKACEYGIRATIYIAEQSLLKRKVNLKETSKAINSPEAFTSKILQQLKKENIIQSKKGPTGGFSMDNHMLNSVKLSTIVFAIDGDDIYNGCALGLNKCSELKPCPVHHEFKTIRDNLKQLLKNTTIKDLTHQLSDGLAFLKQ